MFGDQIAHMISKNQCNLLVSLVFAAQSYFKVHKDVRLNSMHYLKGIKFCGY